MGLSATQELALDVLTGTGEIMAEAPLRYLRFRWPIGCNQNRGLINLEDSHGIVRCLSIKYCFLRATARRVGFEPSRAGLTARCDGCNRRSRYWPSNTACAGERTVFSPIPVSGIARSVLSARFATRARIRVPREGKTIMYIGGISRIIDAAITSDIENVLAIFLIKAVSSLV